LKLVLASANRDKQREFEALLAPLGVTLILQSELGISSVPETGTSFEANSLIKARHAARLSAMAALADDSGLEVDALNGRPGVCSARYAGEAASDQDNNARLLRELAGLDAQRRGARYRCVLALVRDAHDEAPLIACGTWEGHIAMSCVGEEGFGYDPLFVPDGQGGRSAAQLPAGLKNSLSHRAQALAQLASQLQHVRRSR
jgi:XTP/dITP diphosphohydrolase